MKKTFKFFPLFLFIMIFGLACGKDSTEDTPQHNMMSEDMPTEESVSEDSDQEAADSGEIGIDLGEQIIENATLVYETTNFDAAVDFVSEEITTHEGMLEHSNRGQANINQGDTGDYISMTIRLPQEQLHPFIEAIDSFDELYVQTQEIGRQDVTQEYRDNETRISVLEEEEAALRELLQKQGSLEEILQVRRRLSEVISEREIYENQNQLYDDQVAYSTVQLTIEQTERASGQDVSGFWNRLRNAIVDSFYSFIAISQNLIVGFVYFIPHLIVISLVAYIVYRIYKNRKA